MKLDQVLYKDGKPYVLYPGSTKKRYGKIIKCSTCGSDCFVRSEQLKNSSWGKFCSTPCRNTKENNPNWKGGRFFDSRGYIMIPMPKHPKANNRGYVYEHRVLIETRIGRVLGSNDVVHHINGDKSDNRISNLLLTDPVEHRKIHACRA